MLASIAFPLLHRIGSKGSILVVVSWFLLLRLLEVLNVDEGHSADYLVKMEMTHLG